MSNRAPHILVVDDDSRIRTLLGRFLSEYGMFAATMCDAAEARQALKNFRFDLIVLDLMMPGESGLDFANSLRDKGNITPILMLTAMGESSDRIAGLQSGADDYLAKPFEPEELILRIKAILRRAHPAESAIAKPIVFGPYLFDPTSPSLTRNGEQLHLTDAELVILQELARIPGQPVSRESLASSTQNGASPRSVDVQITRLRRKIEDEPRRPRYIQTARGKGYILRGESA